jgi:PKD repeat protein
MKNVAAFLGILAVLTLASGPAAIAQGQLPAEPLADVADVPAPVSEERLTLRVGDVFEIVADAGADGVTTSWILTQERTFIEAGRERLFRYRFVQDKEYTLRGEVTLPGTGERRQRTFVIDVRPVAEIPTMPVYPAGTGASLAGTVPAPDANGRVIFTPEQQLLQLAPIRADLSPLALDLDAARDTDADGNPGNDVDNTDTYFHSFGRSLWIWFARPITQTDLVITAVPAGGSPLVQRISVLSEEAAGEQGVLTSQVSIDVEAIDDATYGFTPVLGRDVPPEAPLLFEWEFGDGDRSLENAPTHVYAASGTYDVKVQVRDLGTGNTVGTSSVSVSVTTVDPGTDEPDPIVDEPDPEPVEEPSTDEGLPWGRIILIGALFIGSLVVGIAIVWLLSFLRRSRKLEETLETMEKAVMPSKEQTPPPLAIKSKPQSPPPSAQQKVIDAELNASSSVKEPPAAVTEAAAPDWLKKGLGSETAAAKPTPAPATPPAPKPAPAVAPAPKPAPAPAPKPQAQTPTPAPQTTPAAPKQPAQPTEAPKPTPSAPPAPPAPKPTPVPTTIPAATEPKPTPSPAPKPQQAAATPPAQASVMPAASPAPARVTTPVAPKPAPAPTPAPVPAPTVTAPPKPVQQSGASQSTPTASPTPAPDTAKLPHWLQPTTPAPAVPTPSPAPVAPTEPLPAPAPTQQGTMPAAPAITEPVITPKPVAPAMPPAPIATPQAPAPTPTLVTPPPAAPIAPKPAPTPSQPILPQEPKDDDRPIAIIRADSIDPGPAK